MNQDVKKYWVCQACLDAIRGIRYTITGVRLEHKPCESSPRCFDQPRRMKLMDQFNLPQNSLIYNDLTKIWYSQISPVYNYPYWEVADIAITVTQQKKGHAHARKSTAAAKKSRMRALLNHFRIHPRSTT